MFTGKHASPGFCVLFFLCAGSIYPCGNLLYYRGIPEMALSRAGE